jgi:hypothetical protein
MKKMPKLIPCAVGEGADIEGKPMRNVFLLAAGLAIAATSVTAQVPPTLHFTWAQISKNYTEVLFSQGMLGFTVNLSTLFAIILAIGAIGSQQAAQAPLLIIGIKALFQQPQGILRARLAHRCEQLGSEHLADAAQRSARHRVLALGKTVIEARLLQAGFLRQDRKAQTVVSLVAELATEYVIYINVAFRSAHDGRWG